MAGTTLGTAYVQIVPSAQGITGSITKVLSDEATSAGEKAGSIFSKFFSNKTVKRLAVTGAALAAGAGLATAAFKKGIQETAAYGDNIDKMSQKLGLSSDAYQKWDYVLKLAGTEMQNMSTGLKTLTNQFQAAKNGNETSIKAFEQLGISMEDAANMSREDLFGAAITGLQKMGDTTERAALANKLFGRSGQELIPLFNQSADATQELMDKAEKYGMVMPEAAVKASAAFVDSVTTMQMTMTGLKNRMMAEFLPAVTQITDGLGKMFAGDMSGVDDVVNGIKGIVSKIGQMAPQLLQAGARIVGQLIQGLMSKAGDIGNSAGQLVGKIVPKIIEKMPAIIAAGGKLIAGLAKGLISSIPSIISAIGRVGASILSNLKSAVINKIKSLFPIKVGNIFKGIKLPHFKVTGKLSINPPSVPHLSVQWYKQGGIVDGATVFGGIGMGEAGPEAIVPLTPFWDKMDKIAEKAQTTNTFNFYINGEGKNSKEIAEEVKRLFVKEVNNRRLAWQ